MKIKIKLSPCKRPRVLRVYALLMLVATKVDVARTVRGRGFTAGRIGFKEVAPALRGSGSRETRRLMAAFWPSRDNKKPLA